MQNSQDCRRRGIGKAWPSQHLWVLTPCFSLFLHHLSCPEMAGTQQEGVMRGSVRCSGLPHPPLHIPGQGIALSCPLGCPQPPQELCPALLAVVLEALSLPHRPWLCWHLWPPLLDVSFAVPAAPEDKGTSSLTSGSSSSSKTTRPEHLGSKSSFSTPSTPKQQQPRPPPSARTWWDTRDGVTPLSPGSAPQPAEPGCAALIRDTQINPCTAALRRACVVLH